jgi:hypothetical protein
MRLDLFGLPIRLVLRAHPGCSVESFTWHRASKLRQSRGTRACHRTTTIHRAQSATLCETVTLGGCAQRAKALRTFLLVLQAPNEG